MSAAAGGFMQSEMPSVSNATGSSIPAADSSSPNIPMRTTVVASPTTAISSASPPITIVSEIHASPTRDGSTSPLGAEVTIGDGNISSSQVIVGAVSADLTAAGNKATIVASGETPQLITVRVATEGDSNSLETNGSTGTSSGIHSGYVQAYPVYTMGDAVYSNGNTYFTSSSATPVSYSQDNRNSPINGQIIPAGDTYVIHQSSEADLQTVHSTPRTTAANEGGTSYILSDANSGLDADAQTNLAHATRVSPATVQWLMDNYETAEGVSLPRSTLYNHYLRHCADHKLDPVNAASFGKLIRSVFVGLRTRRLGTRGNSKYHYYGIRVKPTSPLANLNDYDSPINLHQHGSSGARKSSNGQGDSQSVPSSQGQKASSPLKSDGQFEGHSQNNSEAAPSPQTLHAQQYLGEYGQAMPVIPEVEFDGLPLPAGVNHQHLNTFSFLYRDHCESILEVVRNLQFSSVENIFKRFWKLSINNNITSADKGSVSELGFEQEGELASNLPLPVIQPLLCCEPILRFVKTVDHSFYQNLVNFLVPDVLRSIPSNLTQSIRNFAKSLEGWLNSAMVGCPPELVRIKINAVSSLAQTLRRYTSLNHLAQAARAVLQNSAQISQMLADLNRVDFRNVQEQASWVSQCDEGIVEQLEEEFKVTLQEQNSLEQWAEWLHLVVHKLLHPHEHKPDFPRHARQFLLKWSFYSSMVIRDLTLRSAASFGSFHLIRLLYDEYMFYLVEHKVATNLKKTPIAIMSQFLGSKSDYNTLNGEGAQHAEESYPTSPYKKVKFESI